VNGCDATAREKHRQTGDEMTWENVVQQTSEMRRRITAAAGADAPAEMNG